MKTKIYAPTKEAIAAAGAQLREGKIVGMPTETVYGLAADAWNDTAVKQIFAVKGRPQDNPLIVHISAFEQIKPLVSQIFPLAKQLADRFWPGPLTMVLPKNPAFCSSVSAGLDTVAIRMPEHPVARALIDAAGTPLAAPSANISGCPSPTTAEHVLSDLNGKLEMILDGGECRVGVESTVVLVEADCLTLLRPGGITPEMLKTVCPNLRIAKGVLEKPDENQRVLSPGMKYRHYAPKLPVIILDGSYEQFSAYVKAQAELFSVGAMVFSGEGEDLGVPYLTYGAGADGSSEAAGLFAALRQADSLACSILYARMPAKDGVGFAVYNRLLRAAAFHQVDLSNPPKIQVIGLTGQTGAGKSTVAAAMQQRGYYQIDCDQLARTAVKPGSETLQALVAEFGSEILNPDQSLNRKALGARVFSDEEALKRLNAITHPKILKLIEAAIAYAAQMGYAGALVDAPTLYESGADRFCDFVICVLAEESIRLQRIMKRDQLTEQQALLRIKAQPPESFYTDKAAKLLFNNGSTEQTIGQLEALLAGG